MQNAFLPFDLAESGSDSGKSSLHAVSETILDGSPSGLMKNYHILEIVDIGNYSTQLKGED